MARIFFSLAFLFISLNMTAQQRPQFHVYGSPTILYRVFTGTSGLREIYADIHSPKIRYDVGVLVTVFKDENFDVETGVGLSRKGLGYGKLTYRDQNNETSGSLTLGLLTDYLEIPVRSIWYTNDSETTYLMAGVSADYLIHAKFTATNRKGDTSGFTEEAPKDLRKLNMGLQVGYGVAAIQSEKLRLDIEPNLKLQLFNVYSGNPNHAFHYYLIGLACKARF